MRSEKIKKIGLIVSWALYDLANQFFALNIVSLYFVRWLTLERHVDEIYYSISFGVSTLFIAVFGLILGIVSDMTGRRRPFLAFLTFLSVIFTMLLGAQSVFAALLFFAIANFGCQTATVFYNALMVDITPKGKSGLVSGIGKMFSYSGAIIAVYLFKPIILKGGLTATFVPTGILFLVFSLPCLIFVKDKNPKREIKMRQILRKEKIREVFAVIRRIFLDAQNFPGMKYFLLASFLAFCAVNAVMSFFSIYATRVFLMPQDAVVDLIILSTLFAIAGSALSGFISDYLGYKRCFGGIFILWIICFISGALVKDPRYYFPIGALTGFTLGSTWVVSRALVVKLVPAEKIGEVFSLFNLAAYISAIIGVFFWGLMLKIFSGFGEWSYRVTLLSQVIFMVVGFVFILRVPDTK